MEAEFDDTMDPELDDQFALTPEERAWIYAPLRCIIYLYACATTGVPIYVGQTLQELRDRDRQHLNRKGSEHSFDRIYTHDTKGQFTLQTLETNEFPTGADAEADAWMDEREAYWIAHHGTYDPTGCRGRNQTPGGQKGAATACRLAQRRAACIKWRTEYMPTFRAWHAQHGTLRHIPDRGHPTLGYLVKSIRAGKTAVPDTCRAELEAMGFVWCVQQAKWELDYMPAFREWHAEHETLRDIPAKGHPTLGSLVDDIRTGNTAVPDACRAELDAMGFVWCVQQARWELDYMPAFRAWHAEHKTLRDIPDRGHPTLKYLVKDIRTWHSSDGEAGSAVPDAYRAELDAMGFLWSKTNLAQHIRGRLRRVAQQMAQTLDVADYQVVAAVSNLYGSGAIGAASASLEALAARYARDRETLSRL